MTDAKTIRSIIVASNVQPPIPDRMCHVVLNFDDQNIEVWVTYQERRKLLLLMDPTERFTKALA